MILFAAKEWFWLIMGVSIVVASCAAMTPTNPNKSSKTGKTSSCTISSSSSSSWITKEQTDDYFEIADQVPFRKDAEATLLSEIDPQKTYRILDLGCGDGRLLSKVLQYCARRNNSEDQNNPKNEDDGNDASSMPMRRMMGIGLDFSPPMMERAKKRFDRDIQSGIVQIVEHNMDHPLPSSAKELLAPLLSKHRKELQQEKANDKSENVAEEELEEEQIEYFDAIVSSFAIHHCTHERKRELYSEIYNLLDPNSGGIFCNLEHVASSTDYVHQRFMEEMPNEREDPDNKLLDVETQLSWMREIGYDDVDCYFKWREIALLIGRKKPVNNKECKNKK